MDGNPLCFVLVFDKFHRLGYLIWSFDLYIPSDLKHMMLDNESVAGNHKQKACGLE